MKNQLIIMSCLMITHEHTLVFNLMIGYLFPWIEGLNFHYQTIGINDATFNDIGDRLVRVLGMRNVIKLFKQLSLKKI